MPRRPLAGMDDGGVDPGTTGLDQVRAQIILRYLALVPDLDESNLYDWAASAVEAAARLMVGAFVDCARYGNDAGAFLDQVEQRALELAHEAQPRFLDGKVGDHRIRIDEGSLEPAVRVVCEVVAGELKLDLSADGLSRALAHNGAAGVCQILEKIVAGFTTLPPPPPSHLEARRCYGPHLLAFGRVYASNLEKALERPWEQRNQEQEGAVEFRENIEAPPPVDGEEAAEEDPLLALLRGLIDTEAASDDIGQDVDRPMVAELLRKHSKLSFEQLIAAFRRVARNPLPTYARDADRQIYLAVVEMLAVHGIAYLGVGVEVGVVCDTICPFLAHQIEPETLRLQLDEIADAIERSDLHDRTRLLLAEPIEKICAVPEPLAAEIRLEEIDDPDLETWLRTILDWRQDFINAGLYSGSPQLRTTIYADDSETLDDWFKKWASRSGRPATVLYSAAILVATQH